MAAVVRNAGRFLHHESCPRCGSKDNLGVWDDGHKFCFGCKYYVPPQGGINEIKRAMADNNDNIQNSVFDYNDYTYAIPGPAKAWLAKYGITKQEVEFYGLCWNQRTDSLVFPILNHDNEVVVTNERYFGPDPKHAKYITYGHKSEHPLFINNPSNAGNLVFVEDFVSAIKVSRFASMSPLLGATIPKKAIIHATESYERIRVWLDFNKAIESVGEAARLSQYHPDVGSIITVLDPKEYNNQQLTTILKGHGIIPN